MLGADLTARRQAKGWSQRQLAKAAGVGRSAVQYWEAADRLDPAGWAVRRMTEALGWHIARPVFPSRKRAHGDGLLSLFAGADDRAKERRAAHAARRRVVCGARTRKGTPCRNKSEPGRRRCKFHGGMSTGARTPGGIERIREAQRRRWAGFNAKQSHLGPPTKEAPLPRTS